MGIYPRYSKTEEKPLDPQGVPGSVYTRGWTEYREEPGVTYVRNIIATDWHEFQRDTCFCCSCEDEHTGSDVYCRNHGFAGERPCEVHNMPGSGYDIDDNPIELESVQVVTARLKDQGLRF